MLPSLHDQRLGVGRIDELQRPRDRHHALLHDADLLEQVGDLHRDLARHVGELQRQRQHHGDGADLDRAASATAGSRSRRRRRSAAR